jgi:hypothetical protein
LAISSRDGSDGLFVCIVFLLRPLTAFRPGCTGAFSGAAAIALAEPFTALALLAGDPALSAHILRSALLFLGHGMHRYSSRSVLTGTVHKFAPLVMASCM